MTNPAVDVNILLVLYILVSSLLVFLVSLENIESDQRAEQSRNPGYKHLVDSYFKGSTYGSVDLTLDVRRHLTATGTITVKQDGTGDYTTIQEAVDAVTNPNSARVEITIYSGIYVERVVVPADVSYLTFRGEGLPYPVISWNDTATSAGSTSNSSTVMIDADFFIAKNIVFENTAPAPPPGAVGAQAVALRITGDKAAFYGCQFLGAQDTLYDSRGRHYFKDCFIQGSIDFIFGNGHSIYSGCHINSIATTSGSVTAHRRQTTDETTGYSFIDCNITGTGLILLGRAWGPASRVVFSSTYMSDIITPAGWGDWGNASADTTVFYGEYNNSGPGAELSGRASYALNLTAVDVQPFLELSFIDGDSWIDPNFT